MIGLGMNYPIIKGQNGYFEQIFDSFSNEKIKLINLFKTVEGERYLQPNFGLAVYKYLFEPQTAVLKSNIERDITKKVEFWLPDIIINKLDIDIISGVDKNEITITINFSVSKNPSNYDTLTFNF